MLSVTRRMTGGVALFLATAVLALWAQGSAPAAARNEAGDFNYYMLVLSWSPTYCESQDDQGRDGGQQCSGSRPYAFVLHGLWPQYEDGWPENCPVRERPWVPNDLITRMLEVMPSRNLVIHEYRTHGVCSGLSPEAYFETARKLYQGVKIPERYAGPGQALTVAPAELVQDFLTANPSLENNMISISCSRNRLRDVRICFTKDLKARACGPSVSRRKSCSQEKVALPPVRGGAGSAR
jgi:ribonuclease T2